MVTFSAGPDRHYHVSNFIIQRLRYLVYMLVFSIFLVSTDVMSYMYVFCVGHDEDTVVRETDGLSPDVPESSPSIDPTTPSGSAAPHDEDSPTPMEEDPTPDTRILIRPVGSDA